MNSMLFAALTFSSGSGRGFESRPGYSPKVNVGDEVLEARTVVSLIPSGRPFARKLACSAALLAPHYSLIMRCAQGVPAYISQVPLFDGVLENPLVESNGHMSIQCRPEVIQCADFVA
jgi:hypothetical protein